MLIKLFKFVVLKLIKTGPTMSDKEYKDFNKALKRKEKILSSSKEERVKFLQQIGIYNKNGNLSKPFKELCTPKGQVSL
jgi:hypothetical protein